MVALLAGACEREDRQSRADPVGDETHEKVALTTNAPGDGGPIEVRSGKGKEYEGSAYHVSQGKTLFKAFNCNGCHANGGGGSGPALMDDQWIYGGSIENIVQTIREGRPAGMPSFRGKIPEDQVWEIAAYVRSMGRYVRKDVAPGRDDSMNPRPAESSIERREPVAGGTPAPSAEQPQ
jgi:cytochrome c oxidase cbb3-type subunit 3